MLNSADHSYVGMLSGLPRRSVTTILAEEGFIQKQFYREGRQEYGTQGHKILDAYDKKLRFTAPEMYMRIIPVYQKFLDHTGITIVASEEEVEDVLLEVSGTLDKIALHPTMGHGILDVKFSACGYIYWHSLQTEGYRQALKWHPKYKDLDIKWRGGIIFSPECEIPKLIPHDRERGQSKIWQAICITNADKHRHGVHLPKLTEAEGWV